MIAMYPNDIKHPILAKWLSGTTCYNYWIGRSVLFENPDYIVLKHNSHASYIGRFSDNAACRAYAALFRKADLVPDASGNNRNLAIGSNAMKRWEGRIAKSKLLDDCRAMGIMFEPDATARVEPH